MSEALDLGKQLTDFIDLAILKSPTEKILDRAMMPETEYKAMLNYLTPFFKASVVGAPIADEKSLKDGYENFLYKGVAICLKK